MIIFDLDGTLADCEHRRHFVVKPKQPECTCDPQIYGYDEPPCDIHDWIDWKPDWKSFYEACDKDPPIQPVIDIWNQQISLGMMDVHQIWSGRCESVRDKTEKWLDKHLLCFNPKNLKMRLIGDSTPDDVLKEQWLDEAINDGKTIDFVFDDSETCCNMWKRRGIFVFNCCQHDEEF